MSEKEYKEKCESMFKKNTVLLNTIEEMKMCVNCINSDFMGTNKIYCNRHHEEMNYNSKCNKWEFLKYES